AVPVIKNDELIGLRGIATDISKQKIVENKLTLSEKKFKEEHEHLDLIISSANIGWWDWDIQTGEENYNDRLLVNLGFGLDEAIQDNKHFEKKIHPADVSKVGIDLQDHFSQRTDFYLNEHRLQTKDKKWKWFLDYGRVVSRDDAGEPLRMIGTLQDIDKLKSAELLLLESEHKFKSYVENAPNGFFISDSKANLLEVNETICKMTGYSEKELLSKKIWDIIIKEDRKEVMKQIKVVRETKHSTSELHFLHKRNFIGLMLVDINQFDKNKFLAFITDITELRKNEEEIQKMQKLKSIGTLAGGIAHDFNNILTGVFGNISIAKMITPKEMKSYEFLDRAEKSMDRATKLTKQLLTFSKGGSPVLEDVKIAELVKETVSFDLTGSSVKPIFSCDENLWVVEVDKGQMHQVFSNLTINANQAMNKKGKLFVNCSNELISTDTTDLKKGKYVKITVRDNGEGIEKNNIESIFDPYFTTKETGNGLGLSTVYSIIKKHGGNITIKSEVGVGTTFTVFIPASQSITTEVAENKSKKTLKAENKIDISKKILLMDDNAIIRNVGSQMLEILGYDVKTAKDGNKTIELYKESLHTDHPYDLLIMDLTIPGGMGGKETIKHLLALNPQVKAIVSSGYSSQTNFSQYSENGFIGYVHKPYTIDKLKEALLEVF
ncbi:MAG: PAS domain S-box protein, partial [Candidatus Cloacimonadota bacterium]|nr:PAS domain S-box protein [Candidatus Cloacimonadota bacterium]